MVDGHESLASSRADVPTAVPPAAGAHPDSVDPQRIRLFRQPAWVLRMTILGDRSYPRVQVARAAPLSDPHHYIALLDENGEEICMVRDPTELDAGSQAVLHEELRQRYVTALVQRVHSVRSEAGTSYFDVQTDRGRREFVINDVHQSIKKVGERGCLLMDVNGNRFEISDLQLLDKRSRRLLEFMF